MPPILPAVVLAVDPGTAKCGVAVVARGAPPRVLHRAVVETSGLAAHVLPLLAAHGVEAVLVGNATNGRPVAQAVRALLPPDFPLHQVEEAYTSERARRRYFAENPPRGLARLIPAGMRTPPVPVDDWVAVLLAEAYFG